MHNYYVCFCICYLIVVCLIIWFILCLFSFFDFFSFFYFFVFVFFFFFSSRRRHTRFDCDWSSDVCSSDLYRCQRERTPVVLISDKKRRRAPRYLPRDPPLSEFRSIDF